MKNGIATTIALVFIAVSLTGCTTTDDRMSSVTAVGYYYPPAGYAISDLPHPDPRQGVVGNMISQHFND